MKVYWCARCGPGNFGDSLTPALLEAFGIEASWSPMGAADLVMVGSVLSKVPAGWRGTVLGTGTIRQGMRPDVSRARVLALRGVFSRRAARVRGAVALGDPGILAGVLLPERPPADLARVLVPHYVDRALVAAFPGVPVVDVRQAPAAFLAELARAREVVTSSLHALIAADALGIPHVWMPAPAVIGGSWKFLDYASAFGSGIQPGVQRLTDRPAIEARATVLRLLIRSLAPAAAAAPRVPVFAPR